MKRSDPTPSLISTDTTGNFILDSLGNPTIYTVDNQGKILADNQNGGAPAAAVLFQQSIVNNESGAFTIAQNGGAVTFNQGRLDNAGTVTAGFSSNPGGTVSFEQTTVNNAAGGLIEAQNAGIIQFDGSPVANTGELLATTGGKLVLNGTTNAELVTNFVGAVNGTVQVDANSEIDLQNATVSGGFVTVGGLFKSTGTSAIDAATITINSAGGNLEASGGKLTLTPGTITLSNAGALTVTGGAELDLKDPSISNSSGGKVQIDTGSKLLVEFSTGTLALTGTDGKGMIILSGTALITGASGTNELDNVNNTISGAGTISNLDLDNEAAGTINATGGALVLNTGTTIDNAGLLEATASGTLDVQDSDINNSGTGTLGIAIDATSKLVVDVTSLKLDGGGVVTLTGGAIDGNSMSVNTLDNSDNTIHGYGYIGADLLALHNEGTVNANVASNTLDINTGSGLANAIINDGGTLEATSGGILHIESWVENAGGVILVSGSVLGTSTLTFTGTDTVDGGQFTNDGGAVNIGTTGLGGMTANVTIQSENASPALTDVLTNENGGLWTIASGSTLTLLNDMVNNSGTTDGIITVDGGQFNLSGTDTISGGQLNVDNGGQLTIATSALVTFDNVLVDDNTTTSSPPGIDVASGAILTLQNGSEIDGGRIANAAGTLTIEDDGELRIAGTGATLDGLLITDNDISSANGIDVVSTLTLSDGTQISGGTLTIESGALLQVTAGSGADLATASGATIDHVTVTDSGTNQLNASQLTVTSGTLTLNSDTFKGGVIVITVDSGATLILDHTKIFNAIVHTQPGGTLDVSADSTIQTFQSTLSGNNIVEFWCYADVDR